MSTKKARVLLYFQPSLFENIIDYLVEHSIHKQESIMNSN